MSLSTTEDGFKITRRKGTSGAFNLVTTVGPNVTSYVDTPLEPQTAYYYRIHAYNGSGDSTYAADNVTTPAQPPAPANSPPQAAGCAILEREAPGGGITTPQVMIIFIAASTVICSSTTSARGTITMYPDVGLGVVGM